MLGLPLVAVRSNCFRPISNWGQSIGASHMIRNYILYLGSICTINILCQCVPLYLDLLTQEKRHKITGQFDQAFIIFNNRFTDEFHRLTWQFARQKLQHTCQIVNKYCLICMRYRSKTRNSTIELKCVKTMVFTRHFHSLLPPSSCLAGAHGFPRCRLHTSQ